MNIQLDAVNPAKSKLHSWPQVFGLLGIV